MMPVDGRHHTVLRILQWCLDATVAAGSAWVGGYVERNARLEIAAPPPTPRSATGQARWVQREAARGIVELQDFLDRQPRG